MEIKPMTVHIGAELTGVDLRESLSRQTVDDIRNALLRWKVIFFRDQHLDHDQHVAFARHFGQPTPAHVVFGTAGDNKAIYPVTRNRTAFAARPAAVRVWNDWHTDITAAVNPPFASILRAEVVPPYGGDTAFTSMGAAYAGLSEPMQTFVSALRAVHRFKLATDGEDAQEYNRLVEARDLVSEHPLVTVHPETGQRSLYTNPEFVKAIVGLHERESDVLLEFLWEQCIRTEYTVRFRWQPGSIAFWDNRCTQHLAIRDVYETDHDRTLYRVTLVGDKPVGVDGRMSTSIRGNPIKPLA